MSAVGASTSSLSFANWGIHEPEVGAMEASSDSEEYTSMKPLMTISQPQKKPAVPPLVNAGEMPAASMTSYHRVRRECERLK